MYCTQCGTQLTDGVRFCSQCGTSVAGFRKQRRSGLVRPLATREIAGVCAAFAQEYGWDLSLVRIVAVVLALTGGGGFVAYLVAWACIPNEPEATAASVQAGT